MVAYEVSLRIGLAIQPSAQRHRDVFGLSTWQTFGAVTAAAKLLHLTPTQFDMHLGSPDPWLPYPTVANWGLRRTSVRLRGARTTTIMRQLAGVTAADGRQGLLGNRFILDGPHGFWRMAASDQCDWRQFTAGLGEDWLLPRPQ